MHGHETDISWGDDHTGGLLARAGLVGTAQLRCACKARSQMGGTVAEHLVRSGLVEDDTLTEFYHRVLHVPKLSFDSLQNIPRALLDKIPVDLAVEFRVVPVALDGEDTLTLAMSDPGDRRAVHELEFFTHCYIVRTVVTQRQIEWALKKYYGCQIPLRLDEVRTDLERSDGVPNYFVGNDSASVDISVDNMELEELLVHPANHLNHVVPLPPVVIANGKTSGSSQGEPLLKGPACSSRSARRGNSAQEQRMAGLPHCRWR